MCFASDSDTESDLTVELMPWKLEVTGWMETRSHRLDGATGVALDAINKDCLGDVWW